MRRWLTDQEPLPIPDGRMPSRMLAKTRSAPVIAVNDRRHDHLYHVHRRRQQTFSRTGSANNAPIEAATGLMNSVRVRHTNRRLHARRRPALNGHARNPREPSVRAPNRPEANEVAPNRQEPNVNVPHRREADRNKAVPRQRAHSQHHHEARKVAAVGEAQRNRNVARKRVAADLESVRTTKDYSSFVSSSREASLTISAATKATHTAENTASPTSMNGR